MNDSYETRISTARWMACDIPGNIGWIIWLAGTGLCLREGVTTYALLSLVPALLMLAGIGELISERMAGLDRALPGKRLWRGFGALTAGGAAGVPVAGWGLVTGAGTGRCLGMLAGALLCAIFAGLLLRGYRKREV